MLFRGLPKEAGLSKRVCVWGIMRNIVCLEYGMQCEPELQGIELEDETEQVMESLDVQNTCPEESVKGFKKVVK